MIALYGSYTVANKEVILKVDGPSYPNWVGTEQRRPLASFTQDEIQMVNMAGSAGGRNDLLLKRTK